MLIPQAVRQDYGLTEGGEVVLVGVGSNLEIWNAERFRSDMVMMSDTEEEEALDYLYENYFSGNKDINERKSEQ